MDPSVVFPDKELANSSKLGVVFHIPKVGTVSHDSSSDEEYEERSHRHRCIRPHSAKGVNLNLPSRVLPAKTQAIRPWSAQPKLSKAQTSQSKLSRNTLKRPHLKPPPRSPTASVTSENSVLITAVGLANKKGGDQTPDDASVTSTPSTRLPVLERWAAPAGDAVREDDETESIQSDEQLRRSSRIYPTVDTWLAGSPHDSDEYDTDLDIDDFVKQLADEKPIDPSGKAMYADQCQVQGLVPVSYMQRHLADKNLRMRHHYLGGAGTKPIAVALRSNTITETLDIADNYLQSEGARYIALMMRDNTFITNLNISSNFIGKEGFQTLCTMLETNTTLKALCVSGNQLTDPCAQCLIDALKNNTSLTSLDLSGNDFGELGGIYIGAALSTSEGLVDVDISWNAIRSRGAGAIFSALTKNKSIETLDVSWNGVGQAGADALKVALRINTTLKVLDLSNNHLTTKAAEALSWGLGKNFGVETLVLNLNPLQDSGVESLLKAADRHPNLHLLSLQDIGISRNNFMKIKELESQKNLVILHGGVGGYQRASTSINLVRLFSQFVRSHCSELATACHQYDRDRNGELGVDELKMALRDGGIRLTNGQLSLVIEELNFSGTSTMNYKDILSGKFEDEYYKQRPSRVFTMKTSEENMNSMPDYLHRQLTVA